MPLYTVPKPPLATTSVTMSWLSSICGQTGTVQQPAAQEVDGTDRGETQAASGKERRKRRRAGRKSTDDKAAGRGRAGEGPGRGRGRAGEGPGFVSCDYDMQEKAVYRRVNVPVPCGSSFTTLPSAVASIGDLWSVVVPYTAAACRQAAREATPAACRLAAPPIPLGQGDALYGAVYSPRSRRPSRLPTYLAGQVQAQPQQLLQHRALRHLVVQLLGQGRHRRGRRCCLGAGHWASVAAALLAAASAARRRGRRARGPGAASRTLANSADCRTSPCCVGSR
jgi:hypothetical protein